VVGVIRRSVRDAVAVERDTTRFIDALAYNWVVAGTDAHAKNYALLLAPGQIRLAPFYDLNSLLPYVDHLTTQRLAMRVGRDPNRPLVRVGLNDWRAFAEEAGLAVEVVLDRVTRMAKAVPDAFRAAVGAPDVATLRSRIPARLVDAVGARALACERVS
jgi:serine/threonine-protein kinase HipA